jgi:hypothetical protein
MIRFERPLLEVGPDGPRILVFLAVFVLTTVSGFSGDWHGNGDWHGTQIAAVSTGEGTETPLDTIDGTEGGGTITDTAIPGG